jgi:hypothetical protein
MMMSIPKVSSYESSTDLIKAFKEMIFDKEDEETLRLYFKFRNDRDSTSLTTLGVKHVPGKWKNSEDQEITVELRGVSHTVEGKSQLYCNFLNDNSVYIVDETNDHLVWTSEKDTTKVWRAERNSITLQQRQCEKVEGHSLWRSAWIEIQWKLDADYIKQNPDYIKQNNPTEITWKKSTWRGIPLTDLHD